MRSSCQSGDGEPRNPHSNSADLSYSVGQSKATRESAYGWFKTSGGNGGALHNNYNIIMWRFLLSAHKANPFFDMSCMLCCLFNLKALNWQSRKAPCEGILKRLYTLPECLDRKTTMGMGWNRQPVSGVRKLLRSCLFNWSFTHKKSAVLVLSPSTEPPKIGAT